MAAPRRGSAIATLICFTTLAITEYGVITYVVLPLPSTRADWLFATTFIAPSLAVLSLWLVAFTLRVVGDTLAGIRAVYRWLTGTRRRELPGPTDQELPRMPRRHRHVATRLGDRHIPDSAVTKGTP